MTPTLVFDLETIPDAQALRKLNDFPADWDDVQVVETALMQRQASHGNDFLPTHLHKIAVIGCAFRDANGFRVRTLGQDGDAESLLITHFFKTIERYTPTLVSWNGATFDLPVLHYRSLVHGVAAPRYWDTGEDDRDFRYNNYLNRYHTRHTDLMDVLASYSGAAKAPMDALAQLCGFPGKLGMDGSQVWRAWHQGERDAVRAYCETDVVNTWLLYTRFRLIRGELDESAYEAEIALVRATLAGLEGAHWQEYLRVWDTSTTPVSSETS